MCIMLQVRKTNLKLTIFNWVRFDQFHLNVQLTNPNNNNRQPLFIKNVKE